MFKCFKRANCMCGWAVAVGFLLLVLDVGYLVSAVDGSPGDGFGIAARDQV